MKSVSYSVLYFFIVNGSFSSSGAYEESLLK